jgi:hypothetical protein
VLVVDSFAFLLVWALVFAGVAFEEPLRKPAMHYPAGPRACHPLGMQVHGACRGASLACTLTRG